MRYKTRPGVVLTSICGEYVLVAAKRNLPLCPYVTEINETSAFLWEHLISGATLEELESAVAEEYEIEDPAQAHDAILAFIEQMTELHYLLPKEQGGTHEE